MSMSKNMLEALQGISGESESKNLVEAIDKIAEGGGSGGGVLVVNGTLTIDGGDPSVEFSDASGIDVYQAYMSGKTVILKLLQEFDNNRSLYDLYGSEWMRYIVGEGGRVSFKSLVYIGGAHYLMVNIESSGEISAAFSNT